MSTPYVTTKGEQWKLNGFADVYYIECVRRDGSRRFVSNAALFAELHAVAAERDRLQREAVAFVGQVNKLTNQRNRALAALGHLLDHQRDPSDSAEAFVAERLRLMKLAREARDEVRKEAQLP